MKWTDYVKFASTKIKPVKKAVAKKNVAGWKKGRTHMIEHHEKEKRNSKNVRVVRKRTGGFHEKGTFKKFRTISGISDFDDSKYIRMFERERIEATGLQKQIDALKELLKTKITMEQKKKVRDSISHHQNMLRATNKNIRTIKKHI